MAKRKTEGLSIERFRLLFPRFADAEAFSDLTIEAYLETAGFLCGKDRWGDLWERGCFLFVAHQLAVSQAEAQNGAQAGSGGLVSSMSADGLSVSLDTATSAENGAGFFNATSYGREYWHLRRMVGAGGIQL